ncbi:MAG TPA: hypothetical protein VI454_06800 [Verrucomicrobiae bacterium]|jgi:hypothetical protein
MSCHTPFRYSCFVILSSFVIFHSSFAADETAAKTDARYPFRTDFANAHLPWYQPKALEFPPHYSDRRISGELVSADFIHRTGQFRTSKTGELMDFTMPPYGAINYLNAEADLRDVPPGTFFLFFLNQDAHGGFTRLATMQDQFSMDAGHSFSYRLDELKLAEGKLLTTKRSIPKKLPNLGKKELLVTGETRVWKGEKRVKLNDLVVGDALLFNLGGKTATSPGRCTDIWVGVDTHKLATERQRKKFAEFTKKRGLPGWIDKTEGNKLTVTLFSGDTQSFKKTWMDDFAVGKDLRVVVANDELRTWNPVSDSEKCSLLEIQKLPTDGYGTSGVRLVFTVGNMLEGFRKGRIVRVFGDGWPRKDQFYGESLMGYGYPRLQTAELMENVAKEYPAQFPFRTDYGNEHLPWYQLKAGVAPPPFSEHLVFGELVKVGEDDRSGQFRADRTGELVDFTIIPEGAVKHLNADGKLSDLPPGLRCRFHLYQDDKGAFTRASLVSDEFSFLAANAITWRIEALKLNEGKLHVARQIPDTKNYNGDMERIPDIGHAELLVTADTRVWKGDQQMKLTDLAVGDALLINLTGELPGKPSHCMDIWVGAETHKLVTEREGKRPKTATR